MLAALSAYLKAYGYRLLLGLALTALFAFHALRIIELPFLGAIEYMVYDLRLGMTMPRSVDRRIVIVDIDEKSLAAEGRWPWSRSRMADLVNALFDDYGVKVAGFDIVFAEEERNHELDRALKDARNSGHNEIVEFFQARDTAPDQQFAEALKGREVVLGYYFRASGASDLVSGELPEPYLPAEIAEMLDINAPAAGGYGGNLAALQQSAASGGFFDNPLNDADGVFRRIPLFQSFNGSLYTSLALTVAERFLGLGVDFSEDNEYVYLGDSGIPVDENMAALVPYRGTQGSFPYVSAVDVLEGRAAPETLKDTIVLVGTTAPGLFDLRNTPMQKIYPGVEIHANVVSGILDSRFAHQPEYTVAIELMQVLLIGVILSLVLPIAGPIIGSAVAALMLLVTVALNLWFWSYYQVVLPLTASLLLIALHYTYIMSYGFLVESRNKKLLQVQFGRYVPEKIVEEMSRNPGEYSLEGERRSLSVMFSDVRGFTSLSEQLEPREVTRLMNAYLNHMTSLVQDNLGTIDKYIGDAIMAFWGAPLEDPRHASQAVRTALAMRDRLPLIHQEFEQKGWPELRIGIGLNTGVMAVGNMGSDFRMAYTVMGDAVNIGARLESLTKHYGVMILVSGATRDAAPEYLYRFIDRVRVRGRREAVDVYEPLCRLEDAATETCAVEAFDAVIKSYRNADWGDAIGQLDQLEQKFGESPIYAFYRKRIEFLQDQPPGDGWDGVWDYS